MAPNPADLAPSVHTSDISVYGTSADLMKSISGLTLAEKAVRITDENQVPLHYMSIIKYGE